MYSEELEYLIDAALADGVLTEKEKQILFKRAQAMGIDLDEFEMVLDARLVKMKKTEEQKNQEVHLTKEHGAVLGSMVGKFRKVRARALDVTKKSVEETSGWISKTAKDVGGKASQTAKGAGEWAAKTAKGISDWAQENETIQTALSKGQKVCGFVSDKTISAVQVVGNKFAVLKDDKQVVAAWKKTSEVAGKVGRVSLKGMKVITGVEAVQDRKKSIKTKEEADLLKAEVEATNEAVRDDMNETLENFGKRRLEALHNTVGVFLDYLNRMNQHSKVKEYEFLTQIGIKEEEITELQEVDMRASDAAKVLAVGGGFAVIGVAGTVYAVTGAVTAFAAASTGTAISSLSGAAATNAMLAWLGGGSIAAGGGGVAAGSAVLASCATGVGIAVAAIAVCTLASSFYSRKYTEATQYLADVQEWVAQTEASWVVMAGIKQRVLELQNLTNELEERTIAQLHKLDSYVDSFDSSDMTQVQLFQQSAIMVKSMSELSQVPILDDEGNLNEQANIVITKTEKILNTSL